MKLVLFLCLALGALLTVGAAESKPIKVTVGQEFKISLQSNPTTGYRWQFAKAPDEKILKLLREDYEHPNSNLAGAGGKQIWTFKALAYGKTTLELNYIRSWETNSPPAQSTNFVVYVNLP
jgi:inhibitor of cysteine peptidase